MKSRWLVLAAFVALMVGMLAISGTAWAQANPSGGVSIDGTSLGGGGGAGDTGGGVGIDDTSLGGGGGSGDTGGGVGVDSTSLGGGGGTGDIGGGVGIGGGGANFATQSSFAPGNLGGVGID